MPCSNPSSPAPSAGNYDSLSPDWTLPAVHSIISYDTVAREETVLLGSPPSESGPYADRCGFSRMSAATSPSFGPSALPASRSHRS